MNSPLSGINYATLYFGFKELAFLGLSQFVFQILDSGFRIPVPVPVSSSGCGFLVLGLPAYHHVARLSSCQPRMCADDTNITYAGPDLNSIQSNLNHNLSDLNKWLTSNKLTLNASNNNNSSPMAIFDCSTPGTNLKILIPSFCIHVVDIFVLARLVHA